MRGGHLLLSVNMVFAHYSIEYQSQNGTGQIGVQIGRYGLRAEVLILQGFAGGIAGRKLMVGLEKSNGARNSEPIRQYLE